MAAPTCSEAGGCELDVTVTNTTDEPFSGPLTIIELFSSHRGKIAEGLGNNATLEENPTAPWTCVRQGLPWRCTHNGLQLAAGASTKLKMKMKPGALGPEDRFFGSSTALELAGTGNTTTTSDFVPTSFLLQRTDPAAATQQKSRAMAGGREQVCALLPLKPRPGPTAAPRLNLEKKSVSQFCALGAPCRFEVTITNLGDGPYEGPVAISEHVAVGWRAPRPASASSTDSVTVASASAEWTCTSAAGGSTCETRSNIILAKGQSTVLSVDVTAHGTAKGDVLENCAILTVGAAGEEQTRNAKNCAAAELDPFSLRVIKSGPGNCVPGGACEFKLTLLNDGPIDHNAPVTFTNSMGVGMPSMDIISIQPPLPCESQPQRIPFECTTPDRHPVARGAHEEYKITTRLPALGLPEKIKNCALISRPWTPAPTDVSTSGPPKDAEPGTYECHEVAVAPAAACPAGWNGAYPYCCQSGTEYRDGACRTIAVKTECPDDRPIGNYPNCCPRGSYYKNGSCRFARQPRKSLSAPGALTGATGDAGHTNPSSRKMNTRSQSRSRSRSRK